MDLFSRYTEVWAVDFEFTAAPGDRPAPLCVVGRELRSGRLVRKWLFGNAEAAPPYPTGRDSLFVAYYASAELGCHLALDWPLPARILDLYAEFRLRWSGLKLPHGHSLLGAMASFGLDALDAVEKEAMRALALRGGPYTVEEQRSLLEYCQSDVDALAKLLPAMLPAIDLPLALLRGRYMAAAARIEWTGIPLDAELLDRVRNHWGEIKHRIITTVDANYGVFVPTGRRFIDPRSVRDAALLKIAREWEVDPYELADAVGAVLREDRETRDSSRMIRESVRSVTRSRLRPLVACGSSAVGQATDVDVLDCSEFDSATGTSVGTAKDGKADAGGPAEHRDVATVGAGASSKTQFNPAILHRAADMVRRVGSEGRHPRPLSFSTVMFADFLGRAGIRR